MIVLIVEKPSLVGPLKSALATVKDLQIVALRGHIMGWIYPEKLSWTKTSLLKLVDAQSSRVVIDNDCHRALTSRVIGSKAPIDEVVLALDPDVEGDCIASDVVRLLGDTRFKYTRMMLEEISASALVYAFVNRKQYNVNAGNRAFLRSRVDLLYGAVLTRYLTLRTKTFLTAGRVQTPCINFIAKRHQLQKNHVAQGYRDIACTLGSLKFELGLKLPQDYALEPIKHTIDGPTLIEKKINNGYNTDELCKEVLKSGVKADRVMKLLETLYLNGIISYPRTENNSYNNYASMITALMRLVGVRESYLKLNPDKQVTDHPPITPLKTEAFAKTHRAIATLPAGDLKTVQLIMSLLFKRSVNLLAKANKYRKYVVHFTGLKGQLAQISFYALVEEHSVLNVKTHDNLETDFKANPKYAVVEKTTKAPPSYTTATILNELVKHKLGTKSTRVSIISTLLSHGFINETKKKLAITATGLKITSTLGMQPIASSEFTRVLQTETEKLSSMFDVTNLWAKHKTVLKDWIISKLGC